MKTSLNVSLKKRQEVLHMVQAPGFQIINTENQLKNKEGELWELEGE